MSSIFSYRSRRQFFGVSAAFLGAALMPTINAKNAKSDHQQGFFVPDERQPHVRTLMQWPVNRWVYPDRSFLSLLQKTIATIANTIVAFEPVVMLMDRPYIKAAKSLLSHQVDIWSIPTDDLWCRDSGPLFLNHNAGKQAIHTMNFNGWGNKQVHDHDARVAQLVAERLALPIFDNGIVGEPGGVETDGVGTLLAHASSWVNPNRNRQSKTYIEERLLEAYGARKIIWAPGLKGRDITDDHIDATARFVEPGHVVIQLPKTPEAFPPFSQSAYRTFRILKNATDAQGRKLKITTLMDPVTTRIQTDHFLASYANYYVCNGLVLCAQFGDTQADEFAYNTLQTLYPQHAIIALNIDPLGEIGGGIHCATQQQPAILERI